MVHDQPDWRCRLYDWLEAVLPAGASAGTTSEEVRRTSSGRARREFVR